MPSEVQRVSGVAGRYATALFELALDASALETVARDLTGLKAMLDDSADLRRLVASPVIARAAQIRAIGAVMEQAGMDGLTRRFIGVVARNRRLFALADIIAAFRALHARHRGEVAADVVSARPLSERQIEAIRGGLRQAMGTEVDVHTSVDESLLGGLIVKVGSRMFDASLASKLQKLQLAMKGAR